MEHGTALGSGRACRRNSNRDLTIDQEAERCPVFQDCAPERGFDNSMVIIVENDLSEFIGPLQYIILELLFQFVSKGLPQRNRRCHLLSRCQPCPREPAEECDEDLCGNKD